ncbi:hypothetical protein P7C70_g7612, partial [Phenoliferia sp. Uapishka_3]
MYSLRALREALPSLVLARLRPPAPPLRQLRFVQSAAIASAPLPSLVKSTRSAQPRKLPPPLSVLGLTAQQFVASYPLTSTTLRKYAVWQGFDAEIRRGLFSLQECRALEAALTLAAESLGMPPAEIISLKPGERGIDTRGLWTLLATSAPMRSQASIRQHVRSRHSQVDVKGIWTREEDIKLSTFVSEHGESHKSRELLAKELGRTSQSCYNRWHRLQDDQQNRKNTGRWLVVELERFKRAVNDSGHPEHLRKPGDFWKVVALAVGTRTPKQCRSKK